MQNSQFRRFRVSTLAKGEPFSPEDLARELRARTGDSYGPGSTVRANIGLAAMRALREKLAADPAPADELPAFVTAPVWVRRYDEARRAEVIDDDPQASKLRCSCHGLIGCVS